MGQLTEELQETVASLEQVPVKLPAVVVVVAIVVAEVVVVALDWHTQLTQLCVTWSQVRPGSPHCSPLFILPFPHRAKRLRWPNDGVARRIIVKILMRRRFIFGLVLYRESRSKKC